MSATKAMTDGILQARNRNAVWLRVAEAATQLEVAAINLEEGAVTTEARRRVGLAALLVQGVGRKAARLCAPRPLLPLPSWLSASTSPTLPGVCGSRDRCLAQEAGPSLHRPGRRLLRIPQTERGTATTRTCSARRQRGNTASNSSSASRPKSGATCGWNGAWMRSGT